MSWIDPGVEVLARLKVKQKWTRVTSEDRSEERRLLLEARKQRKRIREKLWDLQNPGKRRSYDKGLYERVKRWAAANPEKVKAARRKYAQSERGRQKNREKVAAYRARQKAKRLELQKNFSTGSLAST